MARAQLRRAAAASEHVGGVRRRSITREQRTRCLAVVVCTAALLLAVGAKEPVHASAPMPSWDAAALVGHTAEGLTDGAPSLDRYMRRLVTRTERSMGRFARILGRVGVVWLWVLLSAGGFLMIAAFSSVADVRMFDLRRQGATLMLRYLAHGTRTFFRILRDRKTPHLARAILAVALLYWLVPLDLIPDAPLVPGFVDDVVIAIAAAKGFIYLCPDTLIATHATAVELRSHS